MAQKKVWIGSTGPFLYDDAADYPDETGVKQQPLRFSAAQPGTIPVINSENGIAAGSGLPYYDSTSKRMGIGTTSPMSTLHVHGGDFYIGRDTSTTERATFSIETFWVNSTDASRKAQATLYVFDTIQRPIITMSGNGLQPQLAFFNNSPVPPPSAFTQTYSATSLTHQSRSASSLTDSTGGTSDGTVSAVSGTGDDGTINDNFKELTEQLNNLITDQRNTAQVLNELIDQLQSYGLAQ